MPVPLDSIALDLIFLRIQIMKVNSKPMRAVKGFPLLAVSLLMFAGAPGVQANTYAVSASFSDGGIQGKTLFNGSFDWNGSSVTNFSGLLSESMWGWNATSNNFTMGTLTAGSAYTGNVYAKPGGYSANEAPLLNLTHQLASSTSGGLVTVSTFLQNSTDVVAGGGYYVEGGNAMAYGNPDNATRNNNAFFTLVFDVSNPGNTPSTFNKIVYGDETALGMMGPMLTGWVGMTGYGDSTNAGSMGGYPLSLNITEITAVPVPAAIWLFASALAGLGLFGCSKESSC
jgi:hypothetical protein